MTAIATTTPIVVAAPAAVPAKYVFSKGEKRFIGLQLLVATAALSIGSLFGPLQALEFSGLTINGRNVYALFQPLLASYYQGLTLHGVLNALIWTTFFITGFFCLTVPFGLRRPLATPKLNWLGFIVMVVGLLTAAVPILLNEASVLYTFYPPLQASWAFYVGLVFVVVGSWIQGYGFYITYYRWRKDNPGVRTPLMTFGSLITMVMWQISTLGIAVEILTQLLPWSLGLLPGVDPQLSRTYFWFTGHPLVYFWLLPAYVSWYAMLPKQAGGKLFSDALARFSFWMFLVLSTPLGFHHQFTDPGVPTIWKTIHAVLTYAVAFPSLLTAFTVVASLEYAGRKRGGKGLLGWIPKLPWRDVSVTPQILAGVLFIFGGIGGITNASYNVNLVIHNTSWVPGHFHLTVASATTLSFMGIAYWLVPHLTHRKLWAPKLALAQAWIWFVGMAIFSNGMHTLGLLGAPRRTPLGVAPYVPANWEPRLLQTAIGGTILFIGAYLFITILVVTVLRKRAPAAEVPEIPEAESIQDPQLTPAWLDRWAPWLTIAILLILLVYGPNLFYQISNMQNTSPGFKLW
ncbi:MAG: b(o/a)3-type cytochrome-c oxidase subunit 1 [Anaerolineae bacterium]|mgnify:FL=1